MTFFKESNEFMIQLSNLGYSRVEFLASELHVGGIPTLGNNFHYLLTTPHGEEFAQLKPRLEILVYESNEERIIQIGNCNSIESL